ncbi:condensin-2 complex subunit H2-like [Hibiscus syriacus]|uniref:Pectinesterase n=1 Tax=Hibiscus syriacus TaxID=106335 RepID=A0A6A3CLW3_HIBSY|nr:pectinesterase-like [Hibiscus syriacus]KAE8728592.1 condensin-2 complex subunit H2-like [Hibiscus syriacus]
MANNVAMIGICSMFLVALVIAVVAGVTHIKNKDAESDGVSASKKAIQVLCEPVDYKQTCVESLSKSNSSDTTELIRTGFQAAMTEIKEVLSKSATIQELQTDVGTKDAFKVCQEVLDYAIDDLENSFQTLGEYKMSKIDDYLMNLKVWLSGAVTSQQTCIDSYVEKNGTAADKMLSLMKKSQELTSNALHMVSGISSILKDLNIPDLENLDSSSGIERKLLSKTVIGFPEWMSSGDRRLLLAADVTPNVTIAKDGSGKYDSITKALAEVPKKNKVRFIIYIKAGVYKENVNVTKAMDNVMFIGEGPTKTIITAHLSSQFDQITTFHTSTVAVNGKHFVAKNIGFENTAGTEGHQAVALRSSGDWASYYNCHFSGYQDTLYANKHRQYYRDCTIKGTVDFIFGDARSLFQNCHIIVRKPADNQNCIVAAHGRDDSKTYTAIVLHNCTISGDKDYLPVKDKNKSYLGRPWKPYAITVIMQSQIDDIITPEGYTPMNGTVGLDTSFYVEVGNRGPGAKTDGRVKWGGIKHMDLNAAKQFTPSIFLESETWIPQLGIPCAPGLL